MYSLSVYILTHQVSLRCKFVYFHPRCVCLYPFQINNITDVGLPTVLICMMPNSSLLPNFRKCFTLLPMFVLNTSRRKWLFLLLWYICGPHIFTTHYLASSVSTCTYLSLFLLLSSLDDKWRDAAGDLFPNSLSHFWS